MTNDELLLDLDVWCDEPPSRKLRKAYAALTAIEAEIASVRADNPFPEHAPTACRITHKRLMPLLRERDRLEARALRLQTRS